MKRILAVVLILCMLTTQPLTLHATEKEDPEELPSTRESEDFSRALARTGQVYDPALSVLTIPATTQKSKAKDYTVMIYMIGSNLESTGAAATSDLNEIEASDLDFSKANVLVYTGGSRRWFSDIPCDRNSILDMSKPWEERIVAETEANADMGAALTLSNYINFCTEYYPAEHYMMIFWDHGGGPIIGYGSDELFSNDSLLLSELREAMDATIFAKGQKLDLVGFDACLMGSLENMCLWSNYADYYIGSEELEPGDGWNYAFLSTINTSADPVEIGTRAIDAYQTFYEAKICDTYNPDLTLALIDLSKSQQTADAVSKISDELTEDLTSVSFAKIQRTRSDAKSFGYIAAASEEEEPTYYDLADLKDLAVQFEPDYPDASKKIIDSVDDMVVHSYTNLDNAAGVSMYFPSKNKWMYLGGSDVLDDNSFSKTYDSFLYNYAKRWVEEKAHDWLLGALSEESDYYTIKLTEDQIASSSECYLEVLYLNDLENYIPALTGYKLEIEEDGTVKVPKDPSMILVTSEDNADTSANLWPVTITEQNKNRIVYHLDRTRVSNSLEMDITSGDVISEFVDISVTSEPDSDEVKIMDVTASSSIGALGKNTIDISGWECLGYSWNGYLVNKGIKGETLPYTQWQSDYIGTTYFSIDQGFAIEKKPLSQIAGEFAFQVILKDTSGDSYATDIVKITGQATEYVEKETPQGKLRFGIYNGEAYVDQYAGSDTRLEIPSEVNGTPVTGIGNVDTSNETVTEIVLPDSIVELSHSCFHGFEALAKIHLNEGLEIIGPFSFSRTLITELDLPSTVKSIEKCAFASMRSLMKIDLDQNIEFMHTAVLMDCPALETISVDGRSTGDGKGFKLVDGVLFSKDTRTLLAYPGAGKTTYTVPEGTETIGYAAFHSGSIQNVSLPSSLKTIGHYAFYNCMQLVPPTLPEGLTTIRTQAFGAQIYSLPAAQKSMQKQKISIPASVETIGIGAFDVFRAREFEVSLQNRYYSDLDGALMNLRGDCMIAPASDGCGTLVYPDGTLSFDWDHTDYLDNYTDDLLMLDQYDIILPASVTQFPQDDYYSSTDKICFHCPAGSAAEAYAIEHGLKYDHLTDLSFTLQDIRQDDGTILTFRVYKDHALLEHVVTEATTLTIPDIVGGQPVTAIGTGSYDLLSDPDEFFSFETNRTVNTITLPATVTEINDDSLNDFTALETMELPEGLLYLGDEALPYSYQLDKLPPNIRSLGYAFSGSSVTSLELPASLFSISNGAFTNYPDLKEFTVDPDNTVFSAKDGVLYDHTGQQLLYYPVGKGTNFTVPEGVLEIVSGAFYYNRSIEEVDLPSTLLSIGKEAFIYCQALKKAELPENLTELADRAFYQCSSLESVTIPSSVSRIGEYCFNGCDSLASVTLQEGLLEIGTCAFYNTPLVKIDLPDSVEKIEYSAFGLSDYDYFEMRSEPYTMHIGSNLTDLADNAFAAFAIDNFDVDPLNPAYASPDGFLTDRSGERLLACPSGKSGDVHVPDCVTWLNFNSFDCAYFMTDLYIPETVTKVEHLSLPVDYVRDDNDELQTIYRAKIHCKKGSAAETYVLENEIPYVID